MTVGYEYRKVNLASLITSRQRLIVPVFCETFKNETVPWCSRACLRSYAAVCTFLRKSAENIAQDRGLTSPVVSKTAKDSSPERRDSTSAFSQLRNNGWRIDWANRIALL